MGNTAPTRQGSIQRPLAPFAAIATDGSVDIVIAQGRTSYYSAKIYGPTRIIPYISTCVRRGRLYIHNDSNEIICTPNSCIPQKPCIHITIPRNAPIRALNIPFNSQIWIENFNGTYLSMQGGYNTRFFVTGRTRLLQANLSGNAYLNALGLPTDTAVIDTTGNARADVCVSKTLYGLASGISNIYYYGEPQLISRYMKDDASILHIQPEHSEEYLPEHPHPPAH